MSKPLLRLFILFCFVLSHITAFGEPASSVPADVNSKINNPCDIKSQNILLQDEINLADSIAYQCLNTLLAISDVGERSKAYTVLKQLLDSSGSPNIKLDAITMYLNRAYKSEDETFLKTLSREYFALTSSLTASCSNDFKLCDQILYSILGTVSILPKMAKELSSQITQATSELPYGILTESTRLRVEAIRSLSDFYGAINFSRDGKRPKWHLQKEKRTELIASLNQLADKLLGYSSVWPEEALETLLPLEYSSMLKTTLTDNQSRELSGALNQNLIQTGQILKAVSIYSERLEQADPTNWLSKYRQSCLSGDDSSTCNAFINSIILYLDYELKLPTREVYLSAFNDLIKIAPSLTPLKIYATKTADQIKSLNGEFAKNFSLEEIEKNELQVSSNYGDFNSFHYQSQRLIAYSANLSVAVNHYQKDTSTKNKDFYDSALKDYERLWFSLKCTAVTTESLSKKIILPFSKIKLSSSICATPNHSIEAIGQNFDAEMLQRWTTQPIKDGLIKAGLLATTIASAGVAGPGASIALGVISRTVLANAAETVISKIALRAANAAIGSLIFTASMKALNAAIGIAPLWVKSQSIYENLVRPWLIGSAIFYMLPYSALASNFLNQIVVKTGLPKNLRPLSQGAIGLTVDTASFSSIEYVQRTIEKLKGERKFIFSNDTNSVIMDNFIFALAFKSVFTMRSQGVDFHNVPQLEGQKK